MAEVNDKLFEDPCESGQRKVETNSPVVYGVEDKPEFLLCVVFAFQVEL